MWCTIKLNCPVGAKHLQNCLGHEPTADEIRNPMSTKCPTLFDRVLACIYEDTNYLCTTFDKRLKDCIESKGDCNDNLARFTWCQHEITCSDEVGKINICLRRKPTLHELLNPEKNVTKANCIPLFTNLAKCLNISNEK